MLFELFEKDDQQKNCARFFKIFSVGFFYILDKISKKIALGFLRVCKYAFFKYLKK